MTGDVNDDGTIQSADIIYAVNYLFKGGPEPQPAEPSVDVNCDGTSTASDLISMVIYVFKSGDPPCDVCEL
jgi:hypothetical protein